MRQIPAVQHRPVGVHVWCPHRQRVVRYVFRQVRTILFDKSCDLQSDLYLSLIMKPSVSTHLFVLDFIGCSYPSFSNMTPPKTRLELNQFYFHERQKNKNTFAPPRKSIIYSIVYV